MSRFKGIEYLKDPQLVADFQKRLGICSLHNRNKEQNVKFINNTDLESGKRKDKLQTNHKDKKTDDEDTNDEGIEEFRQRGSDAQIKTKDFVVKNYFWYYFFYIGTYLGDEIFYSIYFPFWFWNVDYNVGRRIITVWAIVMYIGQSIKDVIKWPRPMNPPAVRVQGKWSLEYGMPSTHAMIAVAIPMSSILFAHYENYEFSLPLASLVALFMCLWVCTSRIYLGMHTLLDVLVGVVLSLSLVIIAVPLLINFEKFIVPWLGTPFVVLAITLSLVIFYPTCDKWTPTRGDTTTVLGCIAGIYMASCIVNHMVAIDKVPLTIKIEYLSDWPVVQRIGIYFIRFLAGILVIIILEVILSTASHTVDRLLGLDPNETRIQRKQRLPGLDLTYKYITYWILGFTVAILPLYLTLGFNLFELGITQKIQDN